MARQRILLSPPGETPAATRYDPGVPGVRDGRFLDVPPAEAAGAAEAVARAWSSGDLWARWKELGGTRREYDKVTKKMAARAAAFRALAGRKPFASRTRAAAKRLAKRRKAG